jgi:arylsulfatase A-like enzyme
MFTGLDPLAHGVTTLDGRLSRQHVTLAERLSDAGYWTGAWVGRNRHSAVGAARGLAQGFRVYEHSPHAKRYRSGFLLRLLDEASYLYIEHTVGRATAQVDAILRWLGTSPPQPFFMFVHLDDVHSQTHRLPYDAPPPFRDRFCPSQLESYSGCEPDGPCATRRLLAIARGTVPHQLEDVERITCLYDGAIAFTDHQVGRLVDGLTEQGLLERTVFVLTADHGEALLEHGDTLHESLYEEVTRVPLLLRLPGGQPAGRDERVVELVDLVPTILHLVGIDSRGPFAGDVLLDPSKTVAAATGGKAFTVGRPADSQLLWRRGDLKLIRDHRRPDRRRRDHAEHELYDLEDDPGETRDLAAERQPEVRSLELELEEHVRASRQRTQTGGFEEEVVELPDAEQERLRALGYVE